MAEITAAAVKALREKTDLPMMECKKALTEAGGDEAKAMQILREMFKKVQEKRADNVTAEGRVFIAAKPDGSEAAMVEIQCESAPVATGEVLQKFGQAMADQLLVRPRCCRCCRIDGSKRCRCQLRPFRNSTKKLSTRSARRSLSTALFA